MARQFGRYLRAQRGETRASRVVATVNGGAIAHSHAHDATRDGLVRRN